MKMKLYTWKDIERHFLLNQTLWKNAIAAIDVYPTDIILYSKNDSQDNIWKIVEILFGNNYDPNKKEIKLDLGTCTLPIIVERDEGVFGERQILPLFANVLYQSSSYPTEKPDPLSHKVIAFHSYKGGVGRTLSLLTFAKAWSTIFNNNSNRLLIIDSDIEAPGLTWLHQESIEDTFSYLDLLTLIQDNKSVDEIVDLACSKLKLSTITIETDSQKVEHVFIPTYRYEEQLIDLYATPESIANSAGKGYLLATVISKICDSLGLCAALVDLRAGISEFSSTLLLDPRVKKYLVTSTSTQSIRGTQMLLKYLLKGLNIGEDTILPEIFLNMIPDSLSESEKNNIFTDLLQCYEQQTSENESLGFTDNVITELPFASELIHLTSTHQIFENLNGRGIYIRIAELIKQNYFVEKRSDIIKETERDALLEKIYNLASSQLTAEGNTNFDILMTASLKYLSRRYTDEIPTAVIMGSKGSGKTFLYRKMSEAADWRNFCKSLNKSSDNISGLFLPIIATKNSSNFIKTLQACIQKAKDQLPDCNVSDSVFLDNAEELKGVKNEEINWLQFWKQLLVKSVFPQYSSLEEVNEKLAESQKKVIFLVDGLEDILTNVSEDKNEQNAVSVLCQDIISQLIAKYPNIGIIIFLRRDMAQSSIAVNFKQFEQTNEKAELKWSSNDALRLVVWLVSQADPSYYNNIKEIEQASQSVIDEALVRLWGKKLGRSTSNEAYSSRWILAALSDFNGQLQARDIIRFLKYASESPKKPTYNDRVIMPTEIRTAVSTCSSEKIEEVKQEYVSLKPIFEKLQALPEDHKTLPLLPEYAKLSSDEERYMIREGYLKREGDVLYLPEIIRHALGFKYGKGARPKVLALTLKS